MACQMGDLLKIIQLNPFLDNLFRKASESNIELYYIGAGCITQTVWNQLFGFPPDHGIKDIDFVYYNSDVSYDKENETIHYIRAWFGNIPFDIDIKNQARIHLWYEQRFGYPIKPHSSLEEAISTWPTTATAIGVRRTTGGDWKVYAPFGLKDLFGGIVRANKVQITKDIYDRKVQRWIQNWPGLTIIPWD